MNDTLKTTEERLEVLEERVRLLLAASLYDQANVSHGDCLQWDWQGRDAETLSQGREAAASARQEIAQRETVPTGGQ